MRYVLDMATNTAVVDGLLGFAMPDDVANDDERPDVLRAIRSTSDLDMQRCKITDWSSGDAFQADLLTHGFDVADLSNLHNLQSQLAHVLDTEQVTEADVEVIREAFTGATLALSSGRRITVQFVSTDGMIMRKGGPNGLAVIDQPMTARNDHGAAVSVHIDQDVLGTPMKQLMDGRAPELFRHAAPDSCNTEGSMLLLNVWIPLQQVTRPLVLGDGSTLDRQRHQLRYALPVEGFLERDEDQKVNDIWSVLHDDAQQWYFRSEMSAREAYVFDTLSTPHGSFIVPGEEVAEHAYVVLASAEDAVRQGDVGALQQILDTVEPIVPAVGSTAALAEAVEEMGRVIEEARHDVAALCGPGSRQWLHDAETARRRVVRKSLELRVVAVIDD